MSGRNKLGPNAAVGTPQGRESQAEWVDAPDAAEAEAVRAAARTDAAGLDDSSTMSEADARREVPRLRTDSANARMTVDFVAADAVRPALTSRRQKSLNKTKTTQYQTLPRAQRAQLTSATKNIVQSADDLEKLNRTVRNVHGNRFDIEDSRVRQRVERLDRAIQAYERHNEREHLVYSTMRAPKPHGNSLNATLAHLRRDAGDPEAEPLTFDGYIPSSHAPSAVDADQHSVVLEIKTRSGQYLGGSDSHPENADHLVARGRSFKVVGVQENVPYEKPDGTRGIHRHVVQLEDVTVDGRTTARH